jgi:hypothetical protein
MVNVRTHDPYSPHLVGDADPDPFAPKQPVIPGRHPAPPVTQPPVEDPTPDPSPVGPVDGLEDLLKPDLVELARQMGLPTTGNKPDLIDRIRDDRANSPK